MAASDQITTIVDRVRGLLGGNGEKVKYSRLPFRLWWRVVGWRHLILLAAVAFTLFPVVWTVSASINPTDTLSGSQLIPDGTTFDNYQVILDNPPESPFMTWLWSSYRISFIVATFSLVLTAMAAYAFSRFRFKGRRVGLLALLLVLQIAHQLSLCLAP